MVDEDKNPTPKNIYALDHDSDEKRVVKMPPEPEEGRTELVAVGLREWTRARASLEGLKSKLEASKEDVRRAVEYARKLEEECDRLAGLAERLDEERGRRQELQKQHQFIVEKLEELSGIRGRYHLERGRREQLEEKAQTKDEKIQTLQREIETLSEALKEAHEAGFRAEIGPLSVELKK